MKNIIEEEYNKLEIKKDVDDIIKRLGIDMTNWYFGECTLGDDFFNVYFSNEKAENHCLNVEFLLRSDMGNIWVLENCEITQD